MPARILVIDDNQINLDLMVYLLRAFGHDALGVSDAVEGLAVVLAGDHDAVLSDILMPSLDGYEIARRMMATPRTSKTPLIAVTALAMVGDRDRVLAAGFDGYISKPINPETFVREVDAYLPPVLRARALDRQPTSANWPESKPPTGPLVLAVDDVPVNLDVVRGALEPFGYRVVDARNATEALEKARRLRPALVLCDVHMPGGDGFMLIERLKDDPELCDIPFVFLSSSMRHPAQQAKGLALGAKRFVLRPIDPAKLVEAVRQVIEAS